MRKFIKYSFLFSSILFALLLAFCKTIPNLNPYEQSFAGILGLATPLLAIINVIFLITWLILRKYFILCIPLLALIFSWKVYSVTIGGHLFSSQHFEKTPNSFSLLSYNVRLLDLYNWSGQKNTRELMIQFFAKQNPTILCLQEFYTGNDSVGKNNIRDIANACHYEYWANCIINENKRGKWGCVIFSHLPIVKSQNHDIDVFGNNLLQQVDVLFQKETISIFNIHLKSNKFSAEEADLIVNGEQVNLSEQTTSKTKLIYQKLEKNAINRGLEAALVSKIITSSKNKKIVCGDLNDIPSSYTYFKMRNTLKDAFLDKGVGIGSTYINKFPVLRIDYIFHSKELYTLGFQKIKIQYSDHYPLLVHFGIDH
ncbi:MAG: endonuclease/exonuclease/phosphatase family protein [Bacteroidetes bacterium]|nr:endonuclease/exonuclease/phosphatase family protein [Bacteroidota bacterium]